MTRARPRSSSFDGSIRRQAARIVIDLNALVVVIGDQRRHLDSFESEPWRNGGGSTRTLARGTHWRVSLAAVTDGAVFSVFPGTDRLFVPVVRNSIELVSTTSVLTDTDGALRFSGDEHIAARVPGGTALAVNLMVSASHLCMESARQEGSLEVAIARRTVK